MRFKKITIAFAQAEMKRAKLALEQAPVKIEKPLGHLNKNLERCFAKRRDTALSKAIRVYEAMIRGNLKLLLRATLHASPSDGGGYSYVYLHPLSLAEVLVIHSPGTKRSLLSDDQRKELKQMIKETLK